ncbi:hypothetical protein ACHAWF_003753 [Thalassiosira exigua]
MAPDPNYIMGWFAAFVGMIGFGSFAVPIKGDAANSVDIDPLVMQSYKSLMCFLTSWLVVLFGQEISFTWWGIVSGLFWVPSGACNIFAIRNAGLAISQGIVASSIVMVSFIWGNLIFHEPVKNQVIAYAAVWMIMAGLYGMSYFSTAESLSAESSTISLEEEPEEEQQDLMRKRNDSDAENDSIPSQPLEISPPSPRRTRTIVILGKPYSRRNLGLCAALMCGTWGGSCLVPMHYSTGDTNGLGYVISFSVGALVITILLWIVRFVIQICKLRSMKEAYDVLPSFHFRVMWMPGATAGSLWSLGNVGSIVAVEHLGQGVRLLLFASVEMFCNIIHFVFISVKVGYSASQAALLVR